MCMQGEKREMMKRVILALVLLCTLSSGRAIALPFNDDMVHDQLKVSEVMRPAPEGSIALGSSARFVKDKDTALALENPIARTERSIQRGERLWATNCTPCHGRYTEDGYKPGPVNQWLPGPDLTADIIAAKPDGHFFSYVYFGGIIMPRYGWKLSIRDHWDLVNYIRKQQKK